MSFPQPSQLLIKLKCKPQAKNYKPQIDTHLQQRQPPIDIDGITKLKQQKIIQIQQCNRTIMHQVTVIDELQMRILQLQNYSHQLERDYIHQHSLQSQSFKSRLQSMRSKPQHPILKSQVWDTVKLLKIQLQQQVRVNRQLYQWRSYLKEHLNRFNAQNKKLAGMGF